MLLSFTLVLLLDIAAPGLKLKFKCTLVVVFKVTTAKKLATLYLMRGDK